MSFITAEFENREARAEDALLWGHPRVLLHLLAGEAFERFAYFGVQSHVALYLANRLLTPEPLDGVLGLGALVTALGLDGAPQKLASALFGLYVSSSASSTTAPGSSAATAAGAAAAAITAASSAAIWIDLPEDTGAVSAAAVWARAAISAIAELVSRYFAPFTGSPRINRLEHSPGLTPESLLARETSS